MVEPMTETMRVVKVTRLTKRYGKMPAIVDLSFSLAPGEVVALLGPNGAGKTTTFKCVLGVTKFEGSIEVNGISVKEDGKAARRYIGYLPQTPAFDTGDTCEEVLNFLAELKGLGPELSGVLLERVRLAGQRRTQVGRLSGGMKQRLALAAALLSNPPVLLLDEPTANLDADSRREFQELLADLRKEGHSIVLSTHFVESLGEITDRVLVLKEGRLTLDMGVAELRRAKQSRRFMVNLNGTASSELYGALERIGIGAERVTRINAQLDEALAVALMGGTDGDEQK